MDNQEKKGILKRLAASLSKTRENMSSGIGSLFRGGNIDEDFYEELEEILIMSDMGVNFTEELLDNLKEKVKKEHIKDTSEAKDLLMTTMKEMMMTQDNDYTFENQKTVILVVGVNGVGKTTTIGKLAKRYKDQNKKVLLAAADTFRAAAKEQLEMWANKTGVQVISGQEGADPAAVVFDATQAAKSRDVDILICDTAGRLHNKKNLMEELKKINKILQKEYSDAVFETFVVLDGTTGQNALSQAKEFNEAADITGIIITKLDGTAKGGIALAIQSELDVPVKYIGVGEKEEDLEKFDADAFVEALFMEDEPTVNESI